MNDTIWSTESSSQGAGGIVSTEQSYKTSGSSPTQLSSDKVTMVLKCAALLLIGIIGAFGNTLTLAAIRTTPRLWTKSNMLLAALTSTHLGMSTIMFPFYSILNLYVYVIAESSCYYLKAIAASYPVGKFMAHTIFSQFIIIAMDRYIAIIYPLHYETKMTMTVIKCLIGGSFVFGLTISGTYYSYLQYINFSSCGSPYSLVMTAVIDCAVHFTMMLITILVYGRVFLVALKHRSKITTTTQELSTQINTISGPAVVPRSGKIEKSKKTRTEFKGARMTAVLICAYTLPLTPIIIGRIMISRGNTQPYATQLVDVGSALGNLNTGFDWVIYGIINRTFRQAFYRLLKIKMDEPTLN